MAQHFLLSAAARSLSPGKVMRMSERGAENVFVRLRWPQTDGKPVCPHCGCQTCYDCRRSQHQPRWRCKACRADFSATSGTLFAWHKLPLRAYLMAIAVFCNEVKGKSMLAFCRDLDVQYKTAFVLAHKLREAMASATKALRIGGDGRTAEIDGAYFGGHIRPENLAADRVDRRLAGNQSGKRQVVVAMRERGGRTLTQVFAAETDAVAAVRLRIAKGTVVHADESPAWNTLHSGFAMQRITTSRATASTVPAPMAPNPTSPVCGAANSDITTTSLGRIFSATPRRRPGAKTCVASATASKFTAWSDWRCGADRRSISAVTGNAHGPPRSAANGPPPQPRPARSSPSPG
jgi:transposase-like protein